jgi:hypothetical protein
MKKHFVYFITLVILCFVALSVAGQSLDGIYKLQKESDGRTPKSDALIQIGFQNGQVQLRAVQPGQVFEDDGTYRVSGGKLFLDLPKMGLHIAGQSFTLDNGVLTLPFKVLGSGAGTSTWVSTWKPSESSEETGRPRSTLQVIVESLREAESQDNAKQRKEMDDRANLRGSFTKGGKARVYYAQASAMFIHGYYYEAWYGFAQAAHDEPSNAIYLNNLAMVLIELDKLDDAKVLLDWTVKVFPRLDPPMGNLGVLYLKRGEYKKAMAILDRAMQISPKTGLYQYAYGKALEGLGRKSDAQGYFEAAWHNGYAGSGREGAPGNGAGGSGGGAAGPGGSGSGHQAGGGSAAPSRGGARGRPGAPGGGQEGRNEGIPKEWVGHYEARYVRASSGLDKNDPKNRFTAFGKGLTTTMIDLQTLACAKSFSMDIDSSGRIRGRGKVMFVYRGKANNPMMSLMPMPGMAGGTPGNFGTNLKNGFQVRDWNFHGRVNPDGRVTIEGMPQGKLDLLNVGKWQKISPWSPMPPEDRAHMRGPFVMTLADYKDAGPAIRVDRFLALNDKLIKRVHYEAYIVKSDKPITPDCKYTEPPKPKCPATEYMKTDISFSPDGVTKITNSRDLGTGKTSTSTSMGAGGASVDSGGNVTISGSMGMATGSVTFNPGDGSYQVSVGMELNTNMGLQAAGEATSPFSISEKLELVYDSRCGWGIKGTMGAQAGPGASASVEGCIFLNAGA